MKSLTVAILAAILPFAVAVPLEKRVLVVETVTNVVVKTVDVTTTVWVKPGTPSPQVQLNNQNNNHHAHLQAHKNKDKMKHEQSVQNAAPNPVPAAAQPQSSPPQQEAYQPPSGPQAAAPVIPDTPIVAVAVPPPQTTPPPQTILPLQAAASPQPQAQAAAPEPATPAPADVAPAKAKEEVSVDSGSTANCGQVGQPCSGEITFYDTGLGACGTTDDGINDNVFALAHGMMGTQSNGNPFCGRKAEVTLDGKTVVGRLVDKCMGCTGQDIDLSHKMFQALANEDRGRIAGVKWKFID
ncbi:MAG: hypothetical protein Q9169_000354 [Polycauliona sp. 2 TL-2023]